MAWDVVNEVETLYTNGPAGGGGAHRIVKEIIAVVSCLIPEDCVQTQTYWFGGHHEVGSKGRGDSASVDSLSQH
jgi:hypothetical protein